MDGMWQDLMVVGVPVVEKAVRTVAVYTFLVVGLRFFGKRELGQLNPLDFIVLLLLSNTVQNAIIGNDNSLLGGILGAAVLFIVNDLLVRYAYKHPRFRRMMVGQPELLIHEGRVSRACLARNYISYDQIVAAARRDGIEHLHDVEEARLEVNGAISFTLREPTATDRYREEILARLDRIEARLPAALGVVLVALLASRVALAQARPSTDVWIAPLRTSGAGLVVGEPRNVTARRGYDNQPSFTPDGRTILFTVIGDDGQADIWRAPVRGGAPERVTRTPESEYSATVTPDGRAFSVIRVEADSTQRLWRFPLDGSGPPSLVLDKIKPVGYHAWAGAHTLVIFVLGNPATLQVVADDRVGTGEVVARNVGRALAKVPGRAAVTFAQLAGDTTWITEVDVRTKAVRRIAAAPRGADYHAWTPDGRLIAAAGSVVYLRDGDRWTPVADLAAAGVRNISRLAISPAGDWLAFVADDRP